MKGVILAGDRNVEIRDFPTPKPGPGEVLVKMKAAGICGSDRGIYLAPAGATPYNKAIAGHEPCGVVAELGDCVDGFSVGDRVMVMWVRGCGNCPACWAGDLDNCQKLDKLAYGWGLNGGFADYMVARAISLLPMPDNLSFAAGAFLTCAATTSYSAVKKVAVSGVDTVAVFGLGPVGLSAIIWAKVMGARVIGIDNVPERIALAHEVGVDESIDFSEKDPVAVIRELTAGKGADAALDCSGHQSGQVSALDCLRLRGRMAFVGMGRESTIPVSRLIMMKSLTCYGCRIYDKATLAEAAALVAERNLPLDKLVTGSYPIEQAREAFEAFFDQGVAGKLVFAWE